MFRSFAAILIVEEGLKPCLFSALSCFLAALVGRLPFLKAPPRLFGAFCASTTSPTANAAITYLTLTEFNLLTDRLLQSLTYL